jgi:hypothetical protein
MYHQWNSSEFLSGCYSFKCTENMSTHASAHTTTTGTDFILAHIPYHVSALLSLEFHRDFNHLRMIKTTNVCTILNSIQVPLGCYWFFREQTKLSNTRCHILLLLKAKP